MIMVLAIVSQRHRLCVTSKRVFGLVPMEALEGDRISTFPGMGCPLVLRPQPGGHHSYIGAASVADLMNGEALRLLNFEIKSILLR